MVGVKVLNFGWHGTLMPTNTHRLEETLYIYVVY